MDLTERQKSEMEYHRQYARDNAHLITDPFSWDVVERPHTRWWNAYWQMYAYLRELGLPGKRVLVVGCGFGEDALRVAKLGGQVDAFDLSPDSLAIARARAEREGLTIAFGQMTAEAMTYADDCFDAVVARDILHHVDVPLAMAEICRVARPGARFILNEIYTHSVAQRFRSSALVDRVLYPRLKRFIYGSAAPYITPDERKLDQRDIRAIGRALGTVEFARYFNVFVRRIVSDRHTTLCKLDRLLLAALRPLGPLLAGRVLLAGRIAT